MKCQLESTCNLVFLQAWSWHHCMFQQGRVDQGPTTQKFFCTLSANGLVIFSSGRCAYLSVTIWELVHHCISLVQRRPVFLVHFIALPESVLLGWKHRYKPLEDRISQMDSKDAKYMRSSLNFIRKHSRNKIYDL